MEVKITKLKSQDAQKLSDLVDIYVNVFEMENFEKPPLKYFEQILEKESIIVFIAEKDEEVIGGLTAHILPSTYFESSEVYIYDLGVKNEFQRDGVGTNLMITLNNYCRELGFKEVFVQAHVVDEHAVDFYKKIGGVSAEEFVHFSFDLENL